MVFPICLGISMDLRFIMIKIRCKMEMQSYTAERPAHPGCAGPPVQRMIKEKRSSRAGRFLWLTPPKTTVMWRWKNQPWMKMYLLLKMVTFHCDASFLEGTLSESWQPVENRSQSRLVSLTDESFSTGLNGRKGKKSIFWFIHNKQHMENHRKTGSKKTSKRMVI